MTEIRWVIREGWDGPEKVLQFRTEQRIYPITANALNWGQGPRYQWTEWTYVPTVDLINGG